MALFEMFLVNFCWVCLLCFVMFLAYLFGLTNMVEMRCKDKEMSYVM